MKNTVDFTALAQDIKSWGQEFGFQAVGISDTELEQADHRLKAWIKKGFHGEMTYLEKNQEKRRHPEQLHPGTIRIISVRMNYLPPSANIKTTLQDKKRAYIARYALGRDYHKLIRKRLERFAHKIDTAVSGLGYRAFADSAPVHEKAIAEKAGLGWIGKNTLVLNRHVGSYFFLGELYTNLPLPADKPTSAHCGSCTACLDICPTNAFVGPYQLDARRCIAYLTIENKGPIPLELRSAMGNRIFGCDDCQMICPWNKFATMTAENDFYPRHELDDSKLIDLFAWDEATFTDKTNGSPIKRAGYIGWLRNIAIALGNAPQSPDILRALRSRLDHPSEMLREHICWAIDRQNA